MEHLSNNNFLKSDIEKPYNVYWRYIINLISPIILGGLIIKSFFVIINRLNITIDDSIPYLILNIIIISSFYYFFKKIHKAQFINLIGKKPNFMLSVIVIIICLVMYIIREYYIKSTVDSTTIEFNSNWNFKILTIYFFSTFISVTTQELIFRSYLLKGLYPLIKSKVLTIIIVTFLFSLLHIGNENGIYEYLTYFIAGLFLAWIVIYTNTIWYAVIVHFFHNFWNQIVSINDFSLFKPLYGMTSREWRFLYDSIEVILICSIIILVLKILKNNRLIIND